MSTMSLNTTTMQSSSKGFSSALLINIPFSPTEQDEQNERLNSSFTETTTSMQNYLSLDLLNRIEIISPVNKKSTSSKETWTTATDDEINLIQMGDTHSSGRFSFNPTSMMQYFSMQNQYFNMQRNSIKSTGMSIDDSSDYLVEMFGRKGWICDECNNFNYESRNKCNRCGIVKTPKRKSYNGEMNNLEDLKHSKNRKGDWKCDNCGNMNYAFRVQCNRCMIAKVSKDKEKEEKKDL